MEQQFVEPSYDGEGSSCLCKSILIVPTVLSTCETGEEHQKSTDAAKKTSLSTLSSLAIRTGAIRNCIIHPRDGPTPFPFLIRSPRSLEQLNAPNRNRHYIHFQRVHRTLCRRRCSHMSSQDGAGEGRASHNKRGAYAEQMEAPLLSPLCIITSQVPRRPLPS